MDYYRPRLEAAIVKYQFPHSKFEAEFQKKHFGEFNPKQIVTIKDLIDALEKRAKTQSVLRKLFCAMINLLEPPSCQKTHCQHYGGAYIWCSCAIGNIPGRCKENRRYLKNKRELGRAC